MKNLIEKLKIIQYGLNAPKDAWNAFAKYSYRSAESILQALKPHLEENGLVLTISDEVTAVADRIYVKATARLTDGTDSIETSAYAREPESKKGADDSQITGAASSYARKYALCGLFAIDDNKDPDATNTHGKAHEPAPPPEPLDLDKALAALKSADDLATLQKYFGNAYKRATDEQKSSLKDLYDQRKADFEAAQEEGARA